MKFGLEAVLTAAAITVPTIGHCIAVDNGEHGISLIASNQPAPTLLHPLRAIDSIPSMPRLKLPSSPAPQDAQRTTRIRVLKCTKMLGVDIYAPGC